LRHCLDSADLLVETKLGDINARGRVEWVVPSSTMFRIPDRNHVRVRWEMSQDTINNYELTEPRLRITIWRY
jgi:hypothetical protein